MEAQNLRKKIIIQLLFSVSVFSFIFSYFSMVPLQFPSLHALNKNGIFLIINGLLVFLAKTSGLVPSSLGFDLSELQILLEIKEALLDKEVLVPNAVVEGEEKEAESELLNVDGGGGGRGVGGGGGRGRGNYHFEDAEEEPESELLNVDGSGGGNCYFEDVVKETESENGLLEEEILVQNDVYGVEEEEEGELLNVDGSGRGGGGGGGGNWHFEDVENEIESENGLFLEDEQEVEDEDHIELMSTEELNKKFEDFIKRMKEEIRIEAQQPIMVK